MESNCLGIIISNPQDQECRVITKPKMKPQPKAKASSRKYNNIREENQEKEEEEIIVGFPWASSRAYTCSFCKRPFQSSQALGGHMNVHQRDRAKLRRSPLPLDSTSTHDHDHGSSSQPIKFLKLYDFSSFGEEDDEPNGRCKIWKKVNKFVKKRATLVGNSNDIDLELKLGF